MSDQKTLSCEEAIGRLASYLDGELDLKSNAELEHHLSLCRSCYSRHDFEQRLKNRISTLGEEDVRPDFERRIQAMVASFTEPDRPTNS